MFRDTQVSEDGPHDAVIGEERENTHLTMAARTPQGVDLIDAGEELGPAAAGASIGRVRAGAAGGRGVQAGRGAGDEFVHSVTPVAVASFRHFALGAKTPW
jgi:hypothetical protein